MLIYWKNKMQKTFHSQKYWMMDKHSSRNWIQRLIDLFAPPLLLSKIALKNLKAQNLKITLSDQIHQNDKDCFDRYLKIH